MVAKLLPAETRAQDLSLVSRCSLDGLRDRLPLQWPAPPDVPPSPKQDYRSHYVYLGWDDLQDPATWEHLELLHRLAGQPRLYVFVPVPPVLEELLGGLVAGVV